MKIFNTVQKNIFSFQLGSMGVQKFTNKGFVILFAIIIAAMITLLGAGIFTVAFKETILSSTASESQSALFAADSGMECVFYHEFVSAPLGATDLVCVGNTITPTIISSSTGATDYEFNFEFVGTPSCGHVNLTHNVPRDVTDSLGITTVQNGTEIVSRGYNVCIQDIPDMTSPFLVERRLEAWYANPAVIIPPGGGGPVGGGGTGSGPILPGGGVLVGGGGGAVDIGGTI